MITNQLIEEIVNEVLKRMSPADTGAKPLLLVIGLASKKNQAHINELKKQWHVVEIGETNNEIPAGIKHAVFLEVNQDLFVKAAIGITDTPESLLLSELMLKNCQVNFVLNRSLTETINRKGEIGVNKNYLNQLLHYKEQLIEFGVRLSSIEHVLPGKNESASISTQAEFTGKLLTKDQVEAWEGDSIYLQSRTIITPLARDLAREKGISVHMDSIKKGK